MVDLVLSLEVGQGTMALVEDSFFQFFSITETFIKKKKLQKSNPTPNDQEKEGMRAIYPLQEKNTTIEKQELQQNSHQAKVNAGEHVRNE